MKDMNLSGSFIKSVHYDEGARRAQVTLKSGDVHSYADVSPATMADWAAADSVGSFFAHVKKNHVGTKH